MTGDDAFLSAHFGLRDKVAIVTGGASGIGEGIVRFLARIGAKVAVADRDIMGAERVAGEIGGIAVAIDIVDALSVERGFDWIERTAGTPWLLVNCAGVQDRKLLLEIDVAEWNRNHEVNLRGSFLCLQAAAKAMIAAGQGGRVVNISSLGARVPMTPGLSAYAASKAGLLGLTCHAASELAAHGITVNAILPGGVVTPGGSNAKGPAISGPATRSPPPLGRCTAEDMAAAVAFFAAPAAARITAQELVVDGGFLLT